MASNPYRTRVLLLGAGRHGSRHLAVLRERDRRGRIELCGVVVATEAHRRQLAASVAAPVHAGFGPHLCAQVDAVVVATPLETHYELVAACLPYAHVLVEKPLAPTATEATALVSMAQQRGRVLMVGHNYRFDPIVAFLREELAARGGPLRFEGRMLTPSRDDPGGDPVLEKLHFLDLVSYLLTPRSERSTSRTSHTRSTR